MKVVENYGQVLSDQHILEPGPRRQFTMNREFAAIQHLVFKSLGIVHYLIGYCSLLTQCTLSRYPSILSEVWGGGGGVVASSTLVSPHAGYVQTCSLNTV